MYKLCCKARRRPVWQKNADREGTGNPLFIKEVVRELIDSGTLELREDAWRLTREVDTIAMPDSLEGTILAQLDRISKQ